jgi:hypothetical protein
MPLVKRFRGMYAALDLGSEKAELSQYVLSSTQALGGAEKIKARAQHSVDAQL